MFIMCMKPCTHIMEEREARRGLPEGLRVECGDKEARGTARSREEEEVLGMCVCSGMDEGQPGGTARVEVTASAERDCSSTRRPDTFMS